MNWEVLLALTKAPRIFSISVAAGAVLAVAWSLGAFGLPSINPAGLTFVFIGATAFAFFLASTGVHLWQGAERTKAARLPAFNTLDQNCRERLTQIFQTGNREFIVPIGHSAVNWVKTLNEKGYIKHSWSGDSGHRYEITSAGWAEIERALQRREGAG